MFCFGKMAKSYKHKWIQNLLSILSGLQATHSALPSSLLKIIFMIYERQHDARKFYIE